MGTKTVLMKFAGLEKNSVCGPIAWPPTRGKTTKGSNRSPWRKKGGNCPPSHLTSVGGNNMPISALLATKEKFVNQKKYKWPHKRNTRPPPPLKKQQPSPVARGHFAKLWGNRLGEERSWETPSPTGTGPWAPGNSSCCSLRMVPQDASAVLAIAVGAFCKRRDGGEWEDEADGASGNLWRGDFSPLKCHVLHAYSQAKKR